MRNLLACCLTLLALQPAFAEVGPRPSEEERRRQEEFMRQREQALRVEVIEKAFAVGMDDRDCLQQANYRLAEKFRDMVSRCESEARRFFPCAIDGKRVAEYPSSIRAVYETGVYDEKKTNEAICRSNSMARAESNAVSSCQSKFGVNCTVSSRATVDYHDIHHIRRYIIAGPREEYHKCKASAAAVPDYRFRVQCAVEAVARPRPMR